MFSFLQSKSFLRDLIPSNYIDIHSHLLPGIDDGAKSLTDTIMLTNSMIEFGTSQIITTPHVIDTIWENNSEIIKEKESVVKVELDQKNIKIPFKAAAEYMMDDSFVKLFRSEKLLTLKDNYVLVEMSYINAPIQLYNILFDLQVAGYTAVLAHPERYLFYHNNFDEYHKLINAGCLLQLNLLSVVGYYGQGIAEIAEKLLKKGMYQFAGSDLHHNRHLAAFGKKVKIKDVKPLKEVLNNNQFFRID